MTKNTYEARAYKFATVLARLFAGCSSLEDFMWALDYYNSTHSRKLRWAHGVSRIAIIRSDYVIKFNMVPDEEWEDGRAGNCESEEAIMPRINHVNDWSRDWTDFCTDEEYQWLVQNVNDLHDGNVGYRNRKVCVIDYAWDAEM